MEGDACFSSRPLVHDVVPIEDRGFDIRQRLRASEEDEKRQRESVIVRFCPRGFAKMAVSLAVKTLRGPGHVFASPNEVERLRIRDRRAWR